MLGGKFAEGDPAEIRKLDEAEGLPQLLSILAANSQQSEVIYSKNGLSFCSRTQNIELHQHSKAHCEPACSTLSSANMSIETATLTLSPTKVLPMPRQSALRLNTHFYCVLAAIKNHNDAQTKSLREHLEQMNPYHFEVLIKDLLEAMDYEDVVVTKQVVTRGRRGWHLSIQSLKSKRSFR